MLVLVWFKGKLSGYICWQRVINSEQLKEIKSSINLEVSFSSLHSWTWVELFKYGNSIIERVESAISGLALPPIGIPQTCLKINWENFTKVVSKMKSISCKISNLK